MIRTLLDIVYPPLCLHCGESCRHALCSVCSEQLELLDPRERCPLCFREKEGRCEPCHKSPPPFHRLAAALPHSGPARTLTHGFKYDNQTHLTSALAGFMTAQLLNLDWPLPDYIVPAPQALARRLLRGYNQSELLASAIAKTLDSKVCKALGRRAGDYGQSHQTKSQRQALSPDSFFLKKGDPLNDKTVLLIDDVYTTGTTLRCCGETLLDAFPARLHALTLCKAGEG